MSMLATQHTDKNEEKKHSKIKNKAIPQNKV